MSAADSRYPGIHPRYVSAVRTELREAVSALNRRLASLYSYMPHKRRPRCTVEEVNPGEFRGSLQPDKPFNGEGPNALLSEHMYPAFGGDLRTVLNRVNGMLIGLTLAERAQRKD